MSTQSNSNEPIHWLVSTIGKRSYIAEYLLESSPPGSVIIGTGNEKFTPGFIACDRAYQVPAITDCCYLETVLDICRDENISAIVTLSDLDVSVLPQIRDELVDLGIACFFPNEEIVHRFGQKNKTFEFLAQSGFRTPQTTEVLEQALEEYGWPLVVKPREGSASQDLGILHDAAAARKHWNSIKHPIAQEFIGGRLVNVETCCDTNGHLLAASVWERHSSVDGETLHAETIDHQAAMDTVVALLQQSPIPGPIDVDLIDRDGELFIIEINTRFGGGYPVSHLAGADFTGAMVKSMSGETIDDIDRYRRGVVMMKEIRPFEYDSSRIIDISKRVTDVSGS